MSTLGTTDAPSPASFQHEALLYQGPSEFGTVVLPLLRDGLSAGASILVAVDADKAELLRDELGPDAGPVRFIDMREVGRNPARIIPVWRAFVEEHAVRGALGVGEPVWPGRTDDELQECELHESLLNMCFADGPPWRLVCPYDVVNLSSVELNTAFDTHPAVPGFPARADASRLRAEPGRFRTPLDEPGGPAEITAFRSPGSLAELRRLVSARGLAAGVDPVRADDIALAVSEVAANSVRYGGGGGTLRIWMDGHSFVCEVRDRGHIDDPLVGRVEPAPLAEGRRGLWLVNQLCDLVQLRSLDDGVVVRLHTDVAPSRVA